MLKPIEIQKDLLYLGVNDRNKELFETLWPLPKGVSYNSYLLLDEKTVLFETVDICFANVFMQKLESALNGKKLDYLIINHMEPDHSGSISILKDRYPDIQIVGNARTVDMVKGFYGITDNLKVIKDEEELSLGNHTLKFYLTPMIHWPETMMTYDITDKLLFSGDAFGSFGTLDGGITDTQLDPEIYMNEMVRYYSNIVGKYGSPVQKALEKFQNVEINTICSTHGPIWTQKEDISKIVSIYDKLSKYEAEDGVVIAYGSMYGNTEQLAETIAIELAKSGIRNIVMHNVSKSHSSYILRDIFKYKSLIIGSPTYNNQLYPEIESLLSKIQNRDIKNRYFSYFGSFSWAGAAVKRIKAFAEESNFEVIGTPIEIKYTLQESTLEQCAILAKSIAEKLKA